MDSTDEAPIIINGSTVLDLDAPKKGWRVESGAVDIFWKESGTGSPGRRFYAFRVLKNGVCFGFSPDVSHNNLSLIAVGIGDAQLCPVDMDDLWRDSPESALAAAETWIRQMTLRAAENEPAPRNYCLSGGRKMIGLEADQSLRTEQSLEWIVQAEAGVNFYNAEADPAHFPVPLPDFGWITPTAPGQVTLAGTREVFDTGSITDIIQGFHGMMAKNIIHGIREGETAERRQYRLSRSKDAAGIAAALQKFRTILAPKEDQESTTGLPPLLGAFVLTGKAAGILVSRETEFNQDTAMEDIPRKNGFRLREVLLDGKWWARDNGPLLGILEQGEIPVALIPDGPTRYRMVNPGTGKQEVITPGRAADLLPTAFMLYRPFPARKLVWKDLIRFGFHGCRRDWNMLLFLGVASGLLGLLTPIATGVILGTYIPQAAVNEILQITLILLAAAGAIALFNIIKGIALVRMEGRMDLAVQAAVWDRLLSLPVPFFKSFTAGDLAVRSLGIMAIREILSGATLNALLTLAFTSFNLAWLFYYDWQLAMVAVGLTCIGFTITFGAGLRTVVYQRKLFDIQGRLTGMVLQFLTGIGKLRTTGTENRAFRVWAEEYVVQKRYNYLSGKINARLAAFNSAFPVMVSMVLFAWFYYLRLGQLTVADFIAFNTAYTTFQTALLQIAMVLPASAHVIPLYQRAKPILDTLPEFDEVSEKPGKISGKLQVSHVDFRYSPEGPVILKDVSIEAGPGEFVAVVGGSGAGKSTLLRLLLGFESPGKGGVFYDDKELKNLDIREVRKQIGVVLQNGKLMAGDIFRNIVGTSNLTLDDAWEAARNVGISDDIEAMPMKMNTLVPAGGGALSGGQCQRLLIARAIASHPRLLFFDEATSALDNKTQAVVSHSLEALKVTRIVIAHRLSTIINADRIYAMKRGEVVESGTYQELMDQKGYFYELAKRQIS